MQFTSIEFLFFLPLVFLAYWALRRSTTVQNLLIVVASYVFYGWWDCSFMGFIFAMTSVSFLGGIAMQYFDEYKFIRKAIVWFTVIFNLGILGVFKYFDFFTMNIARLFSSMGIELGWTTLNLVLPVGISFYTFQSLGYTIDVYRRHITPTRNILGFFAFLSFFPQLVAGPIERATTLLPQFLAKRNFNYSQAVDGMRQILWGLFKKMVIADNCAEGADYIFGHFSQLDSFNLLLGAIFFTFQIYCDFSGYSDIAIGTGKLFGIKLMRNFRFPYFSKNLKEFWQRWHISLNLWFRDYVYIPLGGNRKGLALTIFNLIIVFVLSGLWHGAALNYVMWGTYCGLCLAITLLVQRLRQNIENKRHRSCRVYITKPIMRYCSILATFVAVVIGWIIFRCDTGNMAICYLIRLFTEWRCKSLAFSYTTPLLIYLGVFIAIEIKTRHLEHGLQFSDSGITGHSAVRWAICYLMALSTFVFAGGSTDFIYFQF